MKLKLNRVGGYKWVKLRKKIIKERGSICSKCGRKAKKIIADHKLAIAIGGNEFDENNIQLLCQKCDKKKTSLDLGVISMLNRNFYYYNEIY